MQIKIVNRWSMEIIYECEAYSLRDVVLKCVNELGIDLSHADLSHADLSHADLSHARLGNARLRGADLRGANLSNADLSDATLTGADLSDATLTGADLSDARLRGADLRGANLRGADLRGANLRGANLSDVDLRGANLRGASLGDVGLTPFRDDLWAVLCSAPTEVKALRRALIDGRIDGSTYSGSCACLVGTLANARHCESDQIPGLAPDTSRPSEMFFAAIRPGDTPESNPLSKLALEWVDLWLANMQAAFGATAK